MELGYNVWIEESNIKQVKENLYLAWKSKLDRKTAIEAVMKDAVKNDIIIWYDIDFQSGHFSPVYARIEMKAKYSGKTYLWLN